MPSAKLTVSTPGFLIRAPERAPIRDVPHDRGAVPHRDQTRCPAHEPPPGLGRPQALREEIAEAMGRGEPIESVIQLERPGGPAEDGPGAEPNVLEQATPDRVAPLGGQVQAHRADPISL